MPASVFYMCRGSDGNHPGAVTGCSLRWAYWLFLTATILSAVLTTWLAVWAIHSTRQLRRPLPKTREEVIGHAAALAATIGVVRGAGGKVLWQVAKAWHSKDALVVDGVARDRISCASSYAVDDPGAGSICGSRSDIYGVAPVGGRPVDNHVARGAGGRAVYPPRDDRGSSIPPVGRRICRWKRIDMRQRRRSRRPR